MPSDGFMEYCTTHDAQERWCTQHDVWEFYCGGCGKWYDHSSLVQVSFAWSCQGCARSREAAVSYGDDDVDELFERAKSAYRREREQEQGRIQRDSRYAYDWVQSAIGFLTAIVNCFTAVWNAACYITTAVVEYRGESDDGHTLTVLRRFRKEYILQSGQPSRLLDLLEYQVIAPAVVRRLGVHPGRMAILEWLSGVIAMAVALIEEGREQEAYHLYKTQVLAVNRLIGGADE